MAKTNRKDSRKSKRARHSPTTAVAGKPSKGPEHESKQGQDDEKGGAILKYMREMPLDLLLEVCNFELAVTCTS
jgi:hypothetical protein